MRTKLSGPILAVFALLATPVALACENPDDIVIALRDVAPTAENPGEVVLELDHASRQDISRDPLEFEVDGRTLAFAQEYAAFNVVRVLEGKFDDAQAIVPLGMTTCWFLSVPDGRFVVGRPTEDKQGFTFLALRSMPAPEYHARQSQKAAN